MLALSRFYLLCLYIVISIETIRGLYFLGALWGVSSYLYNSKIQIFLLYCFVDKELSEVYTSWYSYFTLIFGSISMIYYMSIQHRLTRKDKFIQKMELGHYFRSLVKWILMASFLKGFNFILSNIYQIQIDSIFAYEVFIKQGTFFFYNVGIKIILLFISINFLMMYSLYVTMSSYLILKKQKARS